MASRLAAIRPQVPACKDQVHAVLAKLGIPVTCSDIFGKAGSAWLDGLGLPQPYAGKVTSLQMMPTGGCRPRSPSSAKSWRDQMFALASLTDFPGRLTLI
jgi:hypothetical protein